MSVQLADGVGDRNTATFFGGRPLRYFTISVAAAWYQLFSMKTWHRIIVYIFLRWSHAINSYYITTHWSRCSSAEYVGYYRSVCTQYFCACDTYTYKSCDSFLCTELFGFWDSNKLGIFGSEIRPPNTWRNRCVMVGPLGLLLTGTGYGEHVSEFGLAVLIGDLLQSGHCSDSFLLLRFLLLGALQIKTQNN